MKNTALAAHLMASSCDGHLYDVRTWPGGYPLYFVMFDGEPMCFACARKEFKRIAADFHACLFQWRIVGSEVNWEGPDLLCCHCHKVIEVAYE